jgi:pSer/pThr/pTyr-binding forkhead associated (FHA) protein
MVDEVEISVPGDVYLIINNQVFPVDKDCVSIGRRLENDIVLQEDVVSRHHAQIRFEFGEFVIYDLNSTSGTFVNNKKISRCELKSGDIILLAGIPIMFVDNGERVRNRSGKQTQRLDNQSG